MIKIGLLGFGTVGSGVYEIINNSKGQLKESTGQDLYIEKILVRDIEKYKNLDVDSSLLTIDPSETGSDSAATPHVIDATGYFSKNDVLSLDVDTAGTGTTGGVCTLTVVEFSR